MAVENSGQGNADLQFTADLQDNVSPTADQIEKRLKQLGATKSEIKMFLTAYDQATPKIKQAQETLSKLPKQTMINIQTNADAAHKKIDDLKNIAKAPIILTVHVKDDIDSYITNFKLKIQRLQQELSSSIHSMPITGTLLGAGQTAGSILSGPIQSMTGISPTMFMGGAAGATAGIAGFMAQSISMQSQMQQNMMQLTQMLRSPSAAQSEYQNVVAFSNRTPFNMSDVLQSDIALRSQGINPANKTLGLQGAGNLAAATGVNLSQAQGAISAANLGYFQSLNNITGMNIRQTDFTYGGRESGKTYEQAIQQILQRYTGALHDQTETFKGLSTNIQDAIQQKIILPSGQAAFGAVSGLEKSAEKTLTSPGFQLQTAQVIDKMQTGMERFFQLVQSGSSYFKNSLEQPLENITKELWSFSTVMAKSFGSATLTGVKYLAEAFTTLVQPIAKVTSSIPQIGELAGLVKALHMFGISTNTGTKDFFGGLATLNPLKMLSGVREALGMIAKISLYSIVKSLEDMKNANDQVDHSFKDLGNSAGSTMDSLKLKMDSLVMSAGLLGKSVAQIKTYGAVVGEAIGANPAKDPNGKILAASEVAGGMITAQLSTQLGKGTAVNQALATWLKQENAGSQIYAGANPNTVIRGVAEQMVSAADAMHKALGISLPEATQDAVAALKTFGAQLKQNNMQTPMGASLAATLQAGLSSSMTTGDYTTYGGGPITAAQNILSQYAAPGAATIHRALRNRDLNQTWSFLSNNPNITSSGANTSDTNQILSTLRANDRIVTTSQAANAQMNRQFGNLLPGGISLPQFQNPLTASGYMNPSQSQLQGMDPTQLAKMIENFGDSGAKAQQKLQGVNQAITQLNNTLEKYSIVQNEAQAAQSKFDLETIPMQQHIENMQNALQQLQINAIDPLQRAMNALSQQMADYQQNTIVPLQREQDAWNQTMLMTSNRLDDINFRMGQAQYNMTKYNSGMLDGENAMTGQIEKLTIYNEKLQELSLLNNGLQQDISRTQVHEGFSTTIAPLAGFDLAREQQIAQNRLQLKQDQYDTTYGYKHWQLQRAARGLFEREEMPFNERMRGTLSARQIEDVGTVKTRTLENLQYIEQLKSRQLEEKMYAAQVREYPLQDKQYELSKQSFELQQRMSVASDKVSQAQLDLTKKGETIQFHTQKLGDLVTIAEDSKNGIQNRLEKLNTLQGSLQTAVSDINRIEGLLLDNFSDNVQKGMGPVERHLATIVKNTGGSGALVAEMQKLFGGGSGGGGGGGTFVGPRNPNLTHQPWYDTIEHGFGAATNFLNPLYSGPMAYDFAKNGLSTLGAPGLIAGVGGAAVGGYATLAGLNLVRTLGGQAFGRGIGRIGRNLGDTHIGNMLARYGEDGDLEGGLAKTILGGVPLKGILRPMSMLYTKGASIGMGSAGYAAGHLLGGPFGSILGPLLGYFAGETGEAKASNWVQENGLFPGIKALGRGIGNIRSPLDLITHPLGAGGRAMGGAFMDMFSHRSGQFNKIRSWLMDDPDAGHTAQKSIRAVLIDGSRAGEPNALDFGSIFKNALTQSRGALSRVTSSTKNVVEDFYTSPNVKETAKTYGRAAADKLQAAADSFKDSVEKSKTAANLAEDGSSTFRDIVSSKLAGIIETFGGDEAKFGKAGSIIAAAATLYDVASGKIKKVIEGPLSDAINEFKTWTGDFHDVVKGPVEDAANILKKAASTIGDAFDGFKGWATRTLHLGGDANSVLKTATKLGSTAEDAETLDNDLVKSSKLRSILSEAMDHGSKAVEIGGKIFSVAAKGFGALSFAPSVLDLFHGKTAQGLLSAANAGTYLIPGVAEAQLGGQITNWLAGKAGVSSNSGAYNPVTRSSAGSTGLMSGAGGAIIKELGGAWNSIFGGGNNSSIGSGDLAGTTYQNGMLDLVHNGVDIDDLKINRDAALALVKNYDKLTLSEQTQFLSLTANNQQLAAQEALTGAKGLKSYLDSVISMQQFNYQQQTQVQTNAQKDAEQSYTQHYQNVNDIADKGYQQVNQTSQTWFDKLSKGIKNWADANGLSSLVHATNSGGADSSHNSQAGHQGFAHGGLVEGDMHKIGMNRGRMVRMVEEGHPEVVIPLAPHRRDRAKSLVAQTAGILGMANGGQVNPLVGNKLNDNGGSVAGPQNNSDVTAPPGANSHITALIEAANKVNSMNLPYVWGGGHEDPANLKAGGLDCSGTVSFVLQQAGYSVPTTVAADVGSWGFPKGKGAVSIYYNAVHTFMDILGHYFGTSGFARNVGPRQDWGGPGWFTGAPGASYLDEFNVVHLPDLGQLASDVRIGGHGALMGLGDTGGLIDALHLGKPPKELQKMGIVGKLQHQILSKISKEASKKLNSKAGSFGIGGGLLGMSGIASGDWTKVATQIAKKMGWGPDQVNAWRNLEGYEDNSLSLTATNPQSGAYGLAQMLGTPDGVGPAKQKYYTYGGNPNTIVGQLTAMANYIKERYVNPSGALAHEVSHNPHWYAGGITRVTRDNTPAILHAGEQVVSAGSVNSAGAQVGLNEVVRKLSDIWTDEKPMIKAQNDKLDTATKWLQSIEGLSQQTFINSIKRAASSATALGANAQHLVGTAGGIAKSGTGIYGSTTGQVNTAVQNAEASLNQTPVDAVTSVVKKRVANAGSDVNAVTHQRMSNAKSLKIDEADLKKITDKIDALKKKEKTEKKGSSAYKDTAEEIAKLKDKAEEIRKQIDNISHIALVDVKSKTTLGNALGQEGVDKEKVVADKSDIAKLKKAIDSSSTSKAVKSKDETKLKSEEKTLKMDKDSLDKLTKSINGPLTAWEKKEEKAGVSKAVIDAAIKGAIKSGQAETDKTLASLGKIGKYTGASGNKGDTHHGGSSTKVHGKSSGQMDSTLKKVSDTVTKHLATANKHLDVATKHSQTATKHVGVSEKNAAVNVKKLGVANDHLSTAKTHLSTAQEHAATAKSHLQVGTQHLAVGTQHLQVSTHHDATATTHLTVATAHAATAKAHLDASTGHYKNAEAIAGNARDVLKDSNSDQKSGHTDAAGYHKQANADQKTAQSNFNTMITHLQNIANKVQQLNPTVQNNITVNVSGQNTVKATSVGSGSVNTK